MSVRTILEFTSDDDYVEVLQDIGLLMDHVPTVQPRRAWIELVINNLSDLSIGNQDCDITTRELGGKWDLANDILRKHVQAAAKAIRELNIASRDET